MIKLVEVYSVGSFSHTGGGPKENFSLRETCINPKHIVFMREDEEILEKIKDTVLSAELNQQQRFTRIYLSHGQSGVDITVVGELKFIEEKMQVSSLLKG